MLLIIENVPNFNISEVEVNNIEILNILKIVYWYEIFIDYCNNFYKC